MLKLARGLILIFAIVVGFITLAVTLISMGPDGPHRSALNMLPVWLIASALILFLVAGYRKLTQSESARDERAKQRVLAAANASNRLEADSRWFLQTILFSVAVLVFGFGTYVAWDENNWLMFVAFIAGIALFLAFFIDQLQQISRPGPMLVLDIRGLTHAAYGTIPWKEIVGIHLRQVESRGVTHSTLMLGIRQPDRYLATTTFLRRWSMRKMLRERPKYGMFAIPLNPLNKPADLIYATARAMREKISPPMLSFWSPIMGSSEVETFSAFESATEEVKSFGEKTTPAEIEAHMERMKALQPSIDASLAIAKQRTQRSRRNFYLGIAVWILLTAAWIALKILSHHS